MKTYRVSYSGNSSKFINFEGDTYADSKREAVEQVYKELMDANYFPQDNGMIEDCDGNMIADTDDECIEFDGGVFYAEELI